MVQSPLPFQSQPTVRSVKRGVFVLGLLAAHCWEREARVMVVVGKFKFASIASGGCVDLLRCLLHIEVPLDQTSKTFFIDSW